VGLFETPGSISPRKVLGKDIGMGLVGPQEKPFRNLRKVDIKGI